MRFLFILTAIFAPLYAFSASAGEIEILELSYKTLQVSLVIENASGTQGLPKVLSAIVTKEYKGEFVRSSVRSENFVTYFGDILTVTQVGMIERMGHSEKERLILIGFNENKVEGTIKAVAYYPDSQQAQIIANEPDIFIGSDRGIQKGLYPWPVESFSREKLASHFDGENLDKILQGRAAFTYDVGDMTPTLEIENLEMNRLDSLNSGRRRTLSDEIKAREKAVKCVRLLRRRS